MKQKHVDWGKKVEGGSVCPLQSNNLVSISILKKQPLSDRHVLFSMVHEKYHFSWWYAPVKQKIHSLL